ncbi:MAG TPA: hypothetical protein VMI33_26655 [Streptosporangiaceae bacterium]|nr:hypothetical protein [Streptosporangiaceae bacterium]
MTGGHRVCVVQREIIESTPGSGRMPRAWPAASWPGATQACPWRDAGLPMETSLGSQT